MYKKKVTNVSASSKKGARPIFLTEVGKLLKPGESCVLNRMSPGTERRVTEGLLKVEDGSYKREPLFTAEQPTEPAKRTPVAVEVAPPAPQPKVEAAPEEPPAPQPEPAAPSVSMKVVEVEAPAEAEAAPEEADADSPSESESDTETTTSTRRGRRRRS